MSVESPSATEGSEAEEPKYTHTPDALSRVEALLAAEEPSRTEKPTEEPAEGTVGEAEEPAPSPESIYSQKVRLQDGQEKTVGELKDAFKSQAEIGRLESELLKARGTFEADRIRFERERAELMANIPPGSVTRELQEVIGRQRLDYLSRQREELLRVMPEWSDEGKLAAAHDSIAGLAREYRISRAELQGITDYRLFWLLRDAARLREKEAAERAKAPVKVATEPKASRPQTPAQQVGQIKAQRSKGSLSALAAVERIVSGGGGTSPPKRGLRG